MLKRFRDKKKNNKGFTLVELVVVVAILAILVGLLAPQYTKYVEKSRKSADISNLENIVKALEVAASDTDYDVAGKGTNNAEYSVVLEEGGTTVTATNVPGTDWISALKESTGITFASGKKNSALKLKSSKWATDNNTGLGTGNVAIGAKIVIDANGATTVTYDPADIKDTGNQK